MEYLNHVHSIDYVWRKWNPAKWEIQPKANDICGLWHVGLKNLGATCYLNSLIQQLYMIPAFRRGLLSCIDPHVDTTKPEDNLLF